MAPRSQSYAPTSDHCVPDEFTRHQLYQQIHELQVYIGELQLEIAHLRGDLLEHRRGDANVAGRESRESRESRVLAERDELAERATEREIRRAILESDGEKEGTRGS